MEERKKRKELEKKYEDREIERRERNRTKNEKAAIIKRARMRGARRHQLSSLKGNIENIEGKEPKLYKKPTKKKKGKKKRTKKRTKKSLTKKTSSVGSRVRNYLY